MTEELRKQWVIVGSYGSGNREYFFRGIEAGTVIPVRGMTPDFHKAERFSSEELAKTAYRGLKHEVFYNSFEVVTYEYEYGRRVAEALNA